jgi:hypothetical protein
MALVLTIGSVAEFFGEGVIGVLQRAHHGCVNADVKSFEAIEVARRIEKTIDGFSVGTLGIGEAEDRAIR